MTDEVLRIDQTPIEELRERCKALLAANRNLLRERGALPMIKMHRATQTDKFVAEEK